MVNKIDKYLDSVYCEFDYKDKELQELKDEMRRHIIEAANDLKSQGYTEEESIKIAIENFGDSRELDMEISDEFDYRNKDYVFISKAIGIFMLILTIYTKFLSKDDGTYTSVIVPLALIPVYIIYKTVTIWQNNKKQIAMDVRYEYLKISTTLYIVLLFNYLIFPLDFHSGYLKMPFISIVPTLNLSHGLIQILEIMIAFIPFGLLMKLNFNSKIMLEKVILYAIIVFIAYCGIGFIYSLLGSEIIAIKCYEIIGVVIGTSIGYLAHKFIKRVDRRSLV